MGCIREQIGCRIGDLRQRTHPVEQFLRPLGQLGEVGILQRVLKVAACCPSPNCDVLHRVEREADALDPGHLRTQPVDDLSGREVTLATRLQRDPETRSIRRLCKARNSDATGV